MKSKVPDGPSIDADPIVLDLVQLARIQGTHRGFLYQHLYAAICLLTAPSTATSRVRVERDEDVEVVRIAECIYAQVKTRLNGLLAPSDIDGALERFDAIREAHRTGKREGTPRFAIVANVELGPTLAGRDWPPDVTIITPSSTSSARIGLPVPRPTVEQLLGDAHEAASAFRLSALRPESLVAKLVGLIAQAAAGEPPGVSFAADDLERICELVAAQLRPLPIVEHYRPQSSEPLLSGTETALAVVGHAGDGKSAWAAEVAAHSAEIAVYVPCSSAPGEQLAHRLVDAVVATLVARGDARAHELVLAGRTGTDALSLLDRHLAQKGLSVMAIVDDCHYLPTNVVMASVRAAPAIRWLILGRPSQTMSETAALLGISAQSLGGWDNDAIAALLAEAKCSTQPASVEALRSVTDGAPLFVLHAVRAIRETGGGDTGAYARDLAQGTTTGRPAQEVLLAATIDSLPPAAGRIAAALASIDVGLRTDEWLALISESLAILEGEARRSIRMLLDLHVAYSTALDTVSLHDAFRPLLVDSLLSPSETRRFRECAVSLLRAQLLQGQAAERIVAYMRILTSLGRFAEIADVSNALSEWIRETGTIAEIRGHLEASAGSGDVGEEDRFWAIDTLAFFDIEEGQVDAAAARLPAMEVLVARLDESALGAFTHKRALVALKRGDVREVRRLVSGWSGSAAHSRILRYHLALAEGHAGHIEAAVGELHGIADEYLAALGLTKEVVLAKNTPELHAILRPGADVADARHLADCYDAIVKITHPHPKYRELGALPAFWSAKFYDLAGATRSVLRAGQEVVDVMLGVLDDPEQAKRFIESTLLPHAARSKLPEMVIPIRSQYAVVCAHCGDYATADREMANLAPYVSGLSANGQTEIERQRGIIEQLRIRGPLSQRELAARRQRHAERAQVAELLRGRPHLPQAPQPRQATKVPRNSACPCGSGRKYKKCCGKP